MELLGSTQTSKGRSVEEAEGRSKNLGLPCLQMEFEASQGYMNACSNATTKRAGGRERSLSRDLHPSTHLSLIYSAYIDDVD